MSNAWPNSPWPDLATWAFNAYDDGVVEAVTASDTPSSSAVFVAQSSETSTASATDTAVGIYPVAAVASATATDTQSASEVAAPAMQETVTASDSWSALRTSNLSSVETAAASDTSSASLDAVASIVETASATDGVDAANFVLRSTNSTLKRMVDYPHAAVFDKAPHETIVFRLSHPDRAQWQILEAVMYVVSGASSQTYSLEEFTLGELAAALTDDGYTVSDLSGDNAALSAMVLIEGIGDQAQSNGDRVYGYTSLMWVLMDGYASEVRDAGQQVVQALRQMIITQAEGEWLDLFGTLYDVQRRQAEDDTAYQPRIPKEAFRLRESPIAIEEAVFDATGKVIKIEEPWKNIFRLDGSTLSGPDKFQDGERVGYFLIQPTATQPIDWSDVLPIVERNRAAGIVVLPPFSRNVSHVDAGIAGTIDSARTSTHTRHTRYEDRTLLDFSKIEDIPILNIPAWHGRFIQHLSESAHDAPYVIDSLHVRSYRVFDSVSVYQGQYWVNAAWQDIAWTELNVVIDSSHTRS